MREHMLYLLHFCRIFLCLMSFTDAHRNLFNKKQKKKNLASARAVVPNLCDMSPSPPYFI